MKLHLSDGSYDLKIHHDRHPDDRGYRETRAELVPVDGHTRSIRASAKCSPKDNFSRAYGRKKAAERMIHTMRAHGFDKENRQRVFDAICPEYRKGGK